MASTKDNIQLGITGVLIIVLGFLILRGLGKKKGDEDLFYLGEISYDQITGNQEINKMGLYARLEEETKYMKMTRDPFSKQILPSASGPLLNGIVWDPITPRAIINDKIVENGSQINGYTVIKINKDMVILNDNKSNMEFRLELFSGGSGKAPD